MPRSCAPRSPGSRTRGPPGRYPDIVKAARPRLTTPQPRKRPPDDALVEGAPRLELRDEDLGAIVGAIAELLIEVLEREERRELDWREKLEEWRA
jgi:hypothetical protein